MDRVPNEVVWAGIASIVCGVVLVSLLTGTGLPWLVVLVLLGVGFGVTTVRRRRERARYARYRGEAEAGVETPAGRAAPSPRTSVPESRVTGGALLPSPSAVRRAGVRSESLGTAPRQEQDPTR